MRTSRMFLQIMIALALLLLSVPAFSGQHGSKQQSRATADHLSNRQADKTPTPGTVDKRNIAVAHPSATARRAATANYQIPWKTINGGGQPSSSANYSVKASIGQSAIGYATSVGYKAGIGYWYGASTPACSCPFQCDFNEDMVIDAVDLSAEIDVIFFGGLDPQDPNCPLKRGDFNGDGVSDAVDLSALIDYVFFGGSPPVDPCA